jgi:hypothetical protein
MLALVLSASVLFGVTPRDAATLLDWEFHTQKLAVYKM